MLAPCGCETRKISDGAFSVRTVWTVCTGGRWGKGGSSAGRVASLSFLLPHKPAASSSGELDSDRWLPPPGAGAMEASPYGDLLEKTRLPQPLLQRSAVSAVFRKLQAAPPQRDFESRHGRDAVSLCLSSSSAAVVDQAVRELCRLVAAGDVKVGPALVELQSALEGCETRFVGIFVKGIGFLCRCTFRTDPSYWRSQSQTLELHPFVKVNIGGFRLSCVLVQS